MQLRNTVVNIRVLQLKHTRRSWRKGTPTFLLKLVVHLFIKRYPWLHATPDFLCYCTLCDSCGEGCREVKCPYCLKETDLKDYPNKSNSFLKSKKGTTSLKREHAYYYQSQQQIFTTGYHYLCFYRTVNHAVNVLERVERDAPNQKARSCSGTLSLSLSKTTKNSWNKISVLLFWLTNGLTKRYIKTRQTSVKPHPLL